VHLDIIKVLLAIDAQENCFKRSIKIYIKTAPTRFGKSPSSGSVLFELAKVTTITLASSNSALPDGGDYNEICRS
jgi:hypothetical protein